MNNAVQFKVLFENGNYVACITSAGLSVQSKRTGKGKVLPIESKSFQEWKNSFETSVNNAESARLCYAIYHYAQ